VSGVSGKFEVGCSTEIIACGLTATAKDPLNFQQNLADITLTMTKMLTRTAAKRLPLLDGLRGFVAIAVVFHHDNLLFGNTNPFSRAYLAVDFFFMMSGLVITLAYDERLRAGLDPSTFIRQRIARLWPVLAVGILLGGLSAMLNGQVTRGLILTALSLLLIPVLSGRGGIYQIDGPQWSVSFELIANYLHARILHRFGDRTVLKIALVFGIVLAGLAYRFGSVGFGDVVDNWWAGFARIGFGYTLGVWLGRRMLAEKRVGQAFDEWWLAKAAPIPAILLLAPWLPLSRALGDTVLVFVAMPAALWCAAHCDLQGGAERLAGWLGRISYPLYAVHVPVMVGMHSLAERMSPLEAGWMIMLTPAVSFLLAVVLAASGLGYSGARKSRRQYVEFTPKRGGLAKLHIGISG
jgi:peptidoglycan/LPS O-acetylase OafA/YrhL